MEDVVVTEGVVGRENLLARAPGSYGLENAVQLVSQFFWFHITSNLSVHLGMFAAFVMPEL
jgi:hypothetical protein